jgi:SAM-dependent methyltransferase
MDNTYPNYRILTHCRFCSSNNIEIVVDLGKMPLAGAFLKKDELDSELFFPLALQYCNNCHLVQASCVPDPKILFNEKYFFHSSSMSSLVEHFNKYANDVYFKYLSKISLPKVLEIGCNDGILLKPFSKLGCKVIGVDPSSNVTSKIKIDDSLIVTDFFTEKVAKNIYNRIGKVDLVTANFSFAHIDDMHDVMNGIKVILDDNGIFVFEIYYLKTLIEEMNYDMIYHEHMSYYSLITLKKFLNLYNLEIFDVEYNPNIRTGALRVFVKYISNLTIPLSKEFLNYYNKEVEIGLDTIFPYSDYSKRIIETKENLLKIVSKLKKDGKKIIGYGASGRSTVLMNYCGITSEHIEYVIDDAKEKQGYLTPGNHLEIKTWNIMEEEGMPDYIILFAWSFAEEVLEKRKDFLIKGGKFILPLPTVQII